MPGLTVSGAAAETGWSARMLRYLERTGLVVPRRTAGGYRLYGERELRELHGLRELRDRYGAGLTDLVFAARLYGEPALRTAVDSFLAARDDRAWVDWEQSKHERLLAA